MNSNAAGPLIQVAELAAARGREALVVVDCRNDLTAPEAGRLAWLEAHIPGAGYAHLDHDLSGPPNTDHGRHPLPSRRAHGGAVQRPRHRQHAAGGGL